MSGIAEILLTLGFKVSGSDLNLSQVTHRLSAIGATIFEGHHEENVPATASLVVYSSAVTHDNPEMKEAERRHLPVVRRAEVLAELMRLKFGVAVAGSHGKTTTTSMTASILEGAGLDPTVIIGGKVKSMASGGKLGKGEFLVAESDESDRSFLLLKPTIAVITNIDEEHLSAYSSLKDLEDSFTQFAESIPFYGLAILCCDDHKVRRLSETFTKRCITYGLSEDARIRATDIKHGKGWSEYTLTIDGIEKGRVYLAIPGTHLVVNSLAALAVGIELGVPVDTCISALGTFEGVARRLEVVGDARGITVINDYGHHPTEVLATLQAVRDGWADGIRKLHVVFQPHRYSRTRDCFAHFKSCFSVADSVFVTEIYAAGEAAIEGISGTSLAQSIDHPNCHFTSSLEHAGAALDKVIEEGDVVVFLGAGSIGAYAVYFGRERGFSTN